jgi:hypothetical protein
VRQRVFGSRDPALQVQANVIDDKALASGVYRACGEVTQIELRCAQCGEIVTSSHVDVEPGLRS